MKMTLRNENFEVCELRSTKMRTIRFQSDGEGSQNRLQAKVSSFPVLYNEIRIIV